MGYVQQIVFILIAGFAIGWFSRNIGRIRRNILLGRDETYSDNPGARWKNLLLLAFGQKKMFRNPLVALMHFGFMILEMFYWTSPVARRAFGTTAETAEASKALGANQGLYNGFLVAGLIWALVSGRLDLATFFLGCVIVAGIFGAATVKPRIFFVQAVPAILALAATWVWGRG